MQTFVHLCQLLFCMRPYSGRWGIRSQCPLCPADRELVQARILHLQRMSPPTGRTSASRAVGQGPQRTESEGGVPLVRSSFAALPRVCCERSLD